MSYSISTVAPLFPDMIQCMTIQVLEIKKSMSWTSNETED